MIPLTLRSHYSLMWGTASVRELCARARQLGYTSIALTDTDNLYGLWPFLQACRDLGLRPIVGAELTDRNTPDRAVCLVKDLPGYRNLCRLITQRHSNPNFSLKTAISDLGAGLVILTRSPGCLTAWADRCLDIAAALPRHPLPGRHPLCRTAQTLGIPLVATPGSFFLYPGDYPVHQLLRAIAGNTTPQRLGPSDAAPPDAYLASPEHYTRRFITVKKAVDNTHRIAEKLTFTGPNFGIVMPPYSPPEGTNCARLLRQRAYDGAVRRYALPLPRKVVRRIEYELAIIHKMNFDSYFLVVQDIVRRASRTCGRGSGAASIVAYCLDITNVCPIKHNLYFERFLNPDRTDPPDIDIDFAWDERDSLLDGVLTRFSGHSAMVASHILFQPKMAVRETAKVFGLPEGEIKKITGRLPWLWQEEGAGEAELLDRIRTRPEFRHMDFPEPWPGILSRARILIGTPRYLSVHPGGVVITPGPITDYVPVETAPKGVPLIQWEKEGAEAAGLVKIDLLGNRSLGVIRDCITTIKETRGAFKDFDNVDPEDDPSTCRTVARGRTMGCFYIESPAMRLLQQKAGTGDFEHLVIHSSIIRPAANEFIQTYLRRLHTGEWPPLHPLLEHVLDETYGIMVYQEDIARVAVRLAGFTHAQGDGLRKIISKRDKKPILREYYRAFRRGARTRGVSQAAIDQIWKMIISFAGYSFCKPHSASYARVSFQAAYLKTHFPAEFMAAVISNQGGFYATSAYVSEARRMGIDILPPDVCQSGVQWRGKAGRLRVGLMAVKRLSTALMGRIIEERIRAPFRGLMDFYCRTRPGEGEVTHLIQSGSLDALAGKSRAAALWGFYTWKKAAVQKGGRPMALSDADVPDLPPDPPNALLRQEFKALGFLCGCHPMTLFKRHAAALNCVKACDLHRHIGKNVCVAGWLITGKTVQTKQGAPMKFLTFEDETGIVETVFFPEPYARLCHMFDCDHPYILFGRVESDWGAMTINVNKSEKLFSNTQNCNL